MGVHQLSICRGVMSEKETDDDVESFLFLFVSNDGTSRGAGVASL